MPADRIQTFREFWPYYVSQHLDPTCRRLHFVGTSLAIILLTALATTRDLRLLPVTLVCSYGFAWIGHFFFEKNRPATFTYPVWSLIGDFVMYGKTWAGQMGPELARARELHARAE